jgi:4-carboxymuconolactone decarboxylase
LTRRLRHLTRAELTEAQRAVHDAIVGGKRAREQAATSLVEDDGSLRGPFNAMLHAPDIGDRLQSVGAAIRYESSLPDRLRELATLRVAHDRGSRFEIWIHTELAIAAGVTDDELELLADGRLPATLTSSEEAAMQVVDTVLGSGRIGQENYERWRDALDEQALVELTVLAGYYQLLDMLMRLFDVG